MELLYFWVEEYGAIKNQGFNFGGEYLFAYDQAKNELTYRKNEQYIPGFFSSNGDEGNIVNITGIVGKNGAGKSTMLEGLLEFLHLKDPKQGKFSSASDFFIVLKRASSYFVVRKEKRNRQVDESRIKSLGDYSESFELKHSTTPLKEFPEIQHLYHSELKFHYDNIHLRFLENKRRFRDVVYNSTHAEGELLHDYRRDLYQSAIIAVKEHEKILNHVNISFPEMLIWFLPITDIKLLKGDIGKYPKTDTLKEPNIYNKLCRVFADKNLNEDDAKETILGILVRMLKNLEKGKANINETFKLEDVDKLIEEIESFKGNDKTDAINERLLRFYCKYTEKYDAEDVWEAYKTVMKGCSKKTFRALQFDIMSKEFSSVLDAVMTLYDLIGGALNMGIENTFQDDVRLLSSGEVSLLSFIGKLAKFRAVNRFNRDSFLLLLIDEGEIYLHPSWKQKYLSILINFTAYLFEKCNIQIILTSHSPFVVSDLPRNNVLFLERDNEGNISPHNPKRSFGANIHHLFQDAFFMEDGLMGQFAERKIKEVLNWLQDVDTEVPSEGLLSQRDTIYKTIQLIDEPIVKGKLLRMYDQRIKALGSKEQKEKLLKEYMERKRKELGLDS